MKNRTRYLRRTIFPVLFLIPALFSLYLGITRWNGEPGGDGTALMDGSTGNPGDPAFCDALATLLPLPDIELPTPPPGMAWNDRQTHPLMTYSLRDGPWRPAEDPGQYTFVKYLQRPEINAQLDHILSLEPGQYQIPASGCNALSPALELVIARARYKVDAEGDAAGAMEDLARLVRVCRTVAEQPGNYIAFLGRNWESAALEEISIITANADLDADAVKRWQRILLRDGIPFKYLYQKNVQYLHENVMCCIDLAYTCDADGDGWLLLSRLPSPTGVNQPGPFDRCGAWNLLSILYHGRRTEMSKLEAAREMVMAVVDMPFSEAMDHFRTARGPPITMVDGVGAEIRRFQENVPAQYVLAVSLTATRNAALVMMAISAFRHEHHRLPGTLDELVPDFIDELPRDAFDGGPMKYRVAEGGAAFKLYQVGHDEKDDGGINRPRSCGENVPSDFMPRRDHGESTQTIKLRKI